MSNIILAQIFHVQNCITCGIPFAVPQEFDGARRRDGKDFSCPNGHLMSYIRTELDRLRDQLNEKDRLLQQSINREHVLTSDLKRIKSEKRKLAKRLEFGVCPVAGCKRHFTKLQRHIQTEHKDLVLLDPEGAKLLTQ